MKVGQRMLLVDEMMKGLMAEHDVDARIGERDLRAVRMMQFDGRRAAPRRFAFLAHGKAKDAISLYKRALAAREQALGPDHPDTLNARASLAAAYDDAGRIGDALREYQQACAGCERTFGLDHSLTLSRRAGLALSYYAAGQIGDALTELRDSTARAEQALSPADPVTRRLRQAQDDITADLAGA